MSKWYILFLIVNIKIFFIFSCDSSTIGDCDIETLECCNENLLNSLNINSTICNSNIISNNINCYIQVIEDIYKNGDEKDLLKICSGYTNYKDCLGNTFSSCLSINYLNNFLKNQKIVYEISSFIKQLTFICGAGLESFLINDKCISNIFQTKKASLNVCWITFKESMEPLTECANLESFIQCYSNIFYRNCNLESGWWGCEYIKANISSLYPQCYTSCTFS
uniref:DUF19 domain-containing protein n=1 Tax=Strongyloides venezuelensis TaxID=75913 RepID=A0A0K0EWY9_STRVS